MKTCSSFVVAILLALNSFSTCQAMDSTAEWEREFATFARTYPELSIDKQRKSIREYQDGYPLATDEQTKQQQLDQYAVLNALTAYHGTVSQNFDNWIRETDYRNFPDPAEHAPAVISLSRRTKPSVDAIRAVLKGALPFLDNTYGGIATGLQPAALLLPHAEVCATTLRKADRIINEFLTQERTRAPENTISAEGETPLTRFLNADYFHLNVLNESLRVFPALERYSPATRDEYIARICRTVEVADQSWRTEELFRAKVAEILDENFS